MAPIAESDVVGRHGRVGVDVLPHENEVLVARDLRESVDQLFELVDHPARYEQEKSAESTALQTRGAEIAVRDSVELTV